MLPSTRKKIVAVVAGVIAASAPMAVFNYWVDGWIDQQGQEEVDRTVRRAVGLMEARIGRVVASLNELSGKGVDSCRPANLEIMRQATFFNSPIKEMSIIDPAGQILCADIGAAPGPRQVVSTRPATFDENGSIDVMRVGARNDRMLRIRRSIGVNSLAALIPADVVILQVSTQGTALNTSLQLSTPDGTLIGEAGASESAPNADDNFLSARRSDRFAIEARASLSRRAVVASNDDLRSIGFAIAGGIALFTIALTLLVLWRQRGNPIVDLERALNAGEFVPYYQPIVDIKTGKLRGAEVLARWRKPDGTIVLPGSFIPLFETSGLIIDLTRILMRKACQELGPAFAARPHMKIGFNLAACHLVDEVIVKDVDRIFRRSPIRLSQVVLEVTERQPIEDLTVTRRVIAALQGLGVRIAIDDVGTGHAGLSYVLKLGVDIIKIDKMFIDAIGTDRNSTTIIETLIDLADNMRMDIIAEGIETFEQVVHLRELGIRAAQGYVFAPPLPGSLFLQLVEAIDPLSSAAIDEQGAVAGGSSAARNLDRDRAAAG